MLFPFSVSEQEHYRGCRYKERCAWRTILPVDPALDIETRRLYLSAALTTRVLRHIGGRVAADSDARQLLALARDLSAETERFEHAHHLYFEPPYPGVTAGVQYVGGGLRLLLACCASDRDGGSLGVVFTTLIPGRPPQVSVAPVRTPIPEGWRMPEELIPRP